MKGLFSPIILLMFSFLQLIRGEWAFLTMHKDLLSNSDVFPTKFSVYLQISIL
ncbi:hypothetical protein QF028_004556 [Neobacillus sp. B4I6]